MINWQDIHHLLQEEQSIALLYVLDSKGSSPGRQGFRMAVSQSGKMMGSIGGGIMEHKLVELAKSQLKDGQLKPLLKKQIHSKSATDNQSGMICSGEQHIAIIPLLKQDASTIKKIIDSLDKKDQAAMSISPNGLQFHDAANNHFPGFTFDSELDWQYLEVLGFKKYAYIIGGGHVSLALTKTLCDLSFHCTVLDDRVELNTLHDNTAAHQKVVVDYSDIGKHIPQRPDVYIFIMSFGYRTDLQVLKQLIDHQVAFKGMMGSQEKTKQLFEEMIGAGYTNEQLTSIVSPIGLAIKSRTPQEIAISIAAQIIQRQNKNLP